MKPSKPKKLIDWSDLIKADSDSEEINISESPILGGDSPNEGGSYALLEITMNYPRTTRFKNSSTQEQKNLYRILWEKLICFKGMDHIDYFNSRYTYEVCKSGHVHLHGALYLRVPALYYVNGLLADCARAFLKMMPKRYSNYSDAYMHVDWDKYTCPSICIHHVDTTNKERVIEWETYIDKYKSQVIL